jgi:hypothetical protein
MGTGRGGCYTPNLQHAFGGSANFSGQWATVFENVHGGIIHMNRYQGHTSMSWDLLSYCEELQIYLSQTMFNPIAIGITDVNGASMTANITAIWPLPLSGNSVTNYDRIAFYVSGTEDYPDQTLTTILGEGPAMLCLPHLPGEGEEEESSGDGKPPSGDDEPSTCGGSESDEGRGGSGSSNNAATSAVEYTIDMKELQDTLPATPLIYNGDDSIITLDLRLITYKPSALAEILNPKFKSY